MSNNLEKYLSGWSYKGNPIPLDKVGVFRVRGEDTNPDFGGSHHRPDLGSFRGKFEDVAAYAVELNNFWAWGSGGSIEEIVIKEITADSSKKRKALLAEQKVLKKKLKEIEESLGE